LAAALDSSAFAVMALPSSSSDAADRDLIEILAGFELNPETDRALIDRCPCHLSPPSSI
jgi:hypothetical protein